MRWLACFQDSKIPFRIFFPFLSFPLSFILILFVLLHFGSPLVCEQRIHLADVSKGRNAPLTLSLRSDTSLDLPLLTSSAQTNATHRHTHRIRFSVQSEAPNVEKRRGPWFSQEDHSSTHRSSRHSLCLRGRTCRIDARSHITQARYDVGRQSEDVQCNCTAPTQSRCGLLDDNRQPALANNFSQT